MPEVVLDRLQVALQQLRRTEDKVRAYVHVFDDTALTAAREVSQAAPAGPLRGVPFAVKEVFDVAGVETVGGCRAFAGRVPQRDATVVERLRRAGAVLIGTQVSHELTCGLDQPPTRNPWNLECYPGGSSAGAGVSVSVGSAEFALGTDAAGSVRIPAAMTGVVGYKPSLGVVSKCGVMRAASAPSIDNVGIAAGHIAQVRDVFHAISGADPGDLQTLLHAPKVAQASGSETRADLSWRRIARLGPQTLAALDKIYPREPAVERAFDEVCGWLAQMGASIVVVELPSLADAVPAIVTFFSSELSYAHRGASLDDSYHPAVAAMLRSSLEEDVSFRLDRAVAVRLRLVEEIDKAFAWFNADFLLTPTTPRAAMPLSTFDPGTGLASLIPYTCGFNLSGHPAVSLPCGFNEDGLPIGIQIVGKRYDDYALLDLAETVHLSLPIEARSHGLTPAL